MPHFAAASGLSCPSSPRSTGTGVSSFEVGHVHPRRTEHVIRLRHLLVQLGGKACTRTTSSPSPSTLDLAPRAHRSQIGVSSPIPYPRLSVLHPLTLVLQFPKSLQIRRRRTLNLEEGRRAPRRRLGGGTYESVEEEVEAEESVGRGGEVGEGGSRRQC